MHIFGKLVYIFGKLAHIFGKLVHFAWKLVSSGNRGFTMIQFDTKTRRRFLCEAFFSPSSALTQSAPSSGHDQLHCFDPVNS